MAFSAPDIVVDLGTASTRVYVRGKGLVVDEPSLLALNTETNGVVAIGTRARSMRGKTPQKINTAAPMRNGAVADLDNATRMVRHFLLQARRRRRAIFPNVLLSVPCGLTEVERMAVVDALGQAGARAVRVLEKPMAAALGADVPVDDTSGHMVIDLGAGTAEVAVLLAGNIAAVQSTRVAGNALNAALTRYAKKSHSLLLGENSAERLKVAVGVGNRSDSYVSAHGRGLASGMPTEVQMPLAEVSAALEEPMRALVNAVGSMLNDCPPDLVFDLLDRGAMLTGGGALLRGLEDWLAHAINMPVHVSSEPLTATVRGCGRLVENFAQLRSVLDGGATQLNNGASIGSARA